MNRFFRSGLLPLILIVLVVYLASSQLMGGSKNEKKTNHVKTTVDALLTGKPVPAATTTPYGCSVKYKSS